MDGRISDKAFSELNDRIINLLDSFSAISTLSSLDIRHPDVETILRKALQGLMENVDMERCSVFLLENDRLVNCAGMDWDDILIGGTGEDDSRVRETVTASVGEGIMGLAVQTRRLQHCRDCSVDDRFKTFHGPVIGSLISVPIFQMGGDVLGVMNVSHSRPHFFNEWHERLLLVYCNCLGQLIVSHRLVSNMEVEIEKRTGLLKKALEEAHSAECCLRESEKRLSLVLEGSNDGFWDWSLETGMVEFSPRWAENLGYTLEGVEDAFSRGLTLICPEDRAAVQELLALHLGGAVPRYTAEYRMLSSSGDWKWVLDRGKVVESDERGRPLRMTGTTTDISIRKRAEEEKRQLEHQLNHSQKMEAIGQLAGGVAHEFNNILTAIIGYGHLMVMKTEEQSQTRHFASQILTSAERASGLARSLLTFSRKQAASTRHVELNETIRKIGILLSRIIREDIDFGTELWEEPLTVLADDGQIEQVLVNLVTNARDAMPDGGLIKVRTGIAELGAEFVESFGYGKPGRFARISVLDTGIGMEEPIREKIFQPFFTTKEPGKGTGLGLAIVYGIIKQQCGYITVSSNPGEGTEFTIYLPLVQHGGRPMDAAPPSVMRRGTETILIAEDDDDVRRFDRELFEECGYTILEAANGREARDLFMANRDSIDLLIFDVIMPKMNGREVYEEIRQARPGVRILFISGYAGDILNGRGDIGKEFDFMAKPVQPELLLSKVREILDRPSP